MKKLPVAITLLTLISCTSRTEQKAIEVCNCYSAVSHVYGKVPEAYGHMSADEYRDKIQNEFADSCDQLYVEAINSLETDEESVEFFGAYRNCQ